MRLLICGSRDWVDPLPIRAVLKQHCAPITIIEGEARGADSIAREEALALGYEVLRFPANWRQHGKAAGMIRNRQMLVEGKPNLVYAFPTSVNSIGTRNMVGLARTAGIRVVVYKELF